MFPERYLSEVEQHEWTDDLGSEQADTEVGEAPPASLTADGSEETVSDLDDNFWGYDLGEGD
jgi:hypothetical protein